MMSPMERCRWWSMGRDTIGEKGGKTLMVVQGVEPPSTVCISGGMWDAKRKPAGGNRQASLLGVGIPV